MFKGRVRVSSNPIAATPPLPNACSGGQYDVYVGNDPQATIIVHSVVQVLVVSCQKQIQSFYRMGVTFVITLTYCTIFSTRDKH